MTLQVLLPVHTFPEGNADRIAIHAAAVARHLEAEVHALVLVADFPRVSSPLGNMLVDVPAMMGEAKSKCRTRGAAILHALEAEMGSLRKSLRSSELECFPAAFGEAVATHARYHDLVLVAVGSGDPAPQATAEAAIFGSGRPTLLIPEDGPTAAFGHVMIAWDGSRVAARAVADAREFLRRAQTVTVVSVIDEKLLPNEDPGIRLVRYLSKHDTQAAVVRLKGGDRPIAETLQTHARESGVDLIVMGGFGHSRVRDFVLGGATNGILKGLKVPVLLSH